MNTPPRTRRANPSTLGQRTQYGSRRPATISTPHHRVCHHLSDNTWWVIENGNSGTGLCFLDRAWAQSAADALNKGVPKEVYLTERLPAAFTASEGASLDDRMTLGTATREQDEYSSVEKGESPASPSPLSGARTSHPDDGLTAMCL